MKDIRPIAMPGTHENFLKFFEKKEFPRTTKILDIGAGHGAFTQRLLSMGYDVSACDLFPELFELDEIECKKVDITGEFPYPDESFDLVIAIEVSEHIIDHENFFREANRILKPNGQFLLSTPNILSLKSRIRFLFRGYYYSFGPLELRNYNGLQHVNSKTIDQYNYVAVKYGFRTAVVAIDKKQNSSFWLMIFLFPFMWLNAILKRAPMAHNQSNLLLGRLLFLCFIKEDSRERN